MPVEKTHVSDLAAFRFSSGSATGLNFRLETVRWVRVMKMKNLTRVGKERSGQNGEVNELLELMAAYQKSQVLFTFVELEIADLLADGALPAEKIAAAKDIHPLAMERFLNASVVAGLLAKNQGVYESAPLAEKFLVAGGEFYLGGQVTRHRKRSAPAWTKLTESLRQWSYGDEEEERDTPGQDDQGAEAMNEQHNLALLHGAALAEAFDFSNYKKILDIGGGTAATSIALCRKHPHLQSTVFDLPENAELAREIVEKSRTGGRIGIVAGDFKKDELPDDFDLVILANFMAVAEADENLKLLKNINEKLPDGGACLISGWILDDTRLAPDLAVLFCLEDICWNAPDVERSEKIYSDWLKEAGFTNIECRTYLAPTKMLCGFKK